MSESEVQWGVDYNDGTGVKRASSEKMARSWVTAWNGRGPGGAILMRRALTATPWSEQTSPRCPEVTDVCGDELRCNLQPDHDGLHWYGRGIAWSRPEQNDNNRPA